jgi:hypothetical protein
MRMERDVWEGTGAGDLAIADALPERSKKLHGSVAYLRDEDARMCSILISHARYAAAVTS